jgi:glycosyltransferase involved in cell wall biosynthesis
MVEKKADAIVTLTKEDAQEWKNAKRVKIIPNFSIMPIMNRTNCESKKVIAVGRLEWQKGYDRLIHIWEIVTPKHPNWQLDIFGEGSLEAELKSCIQKAGLSNVTIHPFTNNISQEYASSSICVLTSRFEGFSLVLLEAMRHGLPCIAFNCPYGPKDLIDDKKSGYIIENDNIDQFAERLNYLIENIDVRKKFSEEVVLKSNNYNVDNIMYLWRELFCTLTSQKH